jgi:hypothetical protein
MSSTKKYLTAFSLIASTALACSLTLDLGTQPGSTPTAQLSALDHVSTMVAQTLQVFTQQAPTATPTPTETPTSTPLPTFIPPVLTVSTDTSCYAGPGPSYGLVMTLHPGTLATPVGRETSANYWVIDIPNYPGSTCWLSGTYANVTGDTSNLPEVSAPEASSYTLSEPKSLHASCTSTLISSGSGSDEDSLWTVVFRWTNTEPYQTGVRVYRDGRLIATLGPHASSILDSSHHFHHRSDVTYGVQVFNSTQVSSIVTIEIRHCSGE